MQPPPSHRETRRFGCRLSLITGRAIAASLAHWAKRGKSGYICVANTHQVVEARPGSLLHEALEGALAVTTDSQVLGKALRVLGEDYASPILYGPDLMEACIQAAAVDDLTIGLFGSTPETCAKVLERMAREHPDLSVVVCENPGFMTVEELAEPSAIAPIATAKPDVLLVSLGCPKQECWMHLAESRLSGVKIGLGGAFDFYAGIRSRSPDWVHKSGLEWLYRLLAEPHRLWKRYLINNPTFLVLWLGALLSSLFPGQRN